MSRTVLVTGAGGFVGSHVVEALLARTNWHVVATDSFRHNGDYGHLTEVASSPRVAPLVYDLTVPFTPRLLAKIGHVDYVVNVASRCHVGESIADPTEFIANNVRLMLTVLELTRAVQPRQLVHMSTDEVYGYSLPNVWTDHRPSNPYAASKAAQEDICHAYARTYGVRATIVNSANMFGERQSDLGFIPLTVRNLVRGEPVPIHFYQGTPGTRNYTYVRNVAERVLDELLTYEDDDVASNLDVAVPVRRLPLTGQREVDNLTLARSIAQLAGLPLAYHAVDAEAIRPGYDPEYAELADWSPIVDFDEGLKRTVEWAVANAKLVSSGS